MLSELSAFFVFQPVMQEHTIGYQVYYVYNGTIMNGTTVNVHSSNTTTLTFTAPSLPDGVFTGTVVVTVTAVSSIGICQASDPATAIINGKYVHTACT